MLPRWTSQCYFTVHGTGKTSYTFLTVSTLSSTFALHKTPYIFSHTWNMGRQTLRLKYPEQHLTVLTEQTMLFGIDSYGRVGKKCSLCYLHLKRFLLWLCTELHHECKQTSKRALGLAAMEVSLRAVAREALVLVKYFNTSFLHELAKSTSLSIAKGPFFVPLTPSHIHAIQNLGSFTGVLCTESIVRGHTYTR